MTKKEELINFISENVIDGVNELRTIEHFMDTMDPLDRYFSIPKEKLITTIENNFTDDLVGNMPNDPHEVKMLAWQVVSVV